MECKKSSKQKQPLKHQCLVNLGLFRTGTTTLAKAAEKLGLVVKRGFSDFHDVQYRGLIMSPEKEIKKSWLEGQGYDSFLNQITQYDMICDGWAALQILLPMEEIIKLTLAASCINVKLCFVATMRHQHSLIASELHHWVRNNLAKKASLTYQENCDLEAMLYKRANAHSEALQVFSQIIKDKQQTIPNMMLLQLPLNEVTASWPRTLSRWGYSETEWSAALLSVGIQNSNPQLPVEGILLTFRIGDLGSILKKVGILIKKLEEDSICQYLMVVAIDHDEASHPNAKYLLDYIRENARAKEVLLIVNPVQDQAMFPLCQVWHRMAEVAWSRGASWVILLGDDVVIDCPFHYRAIYRAFLQLSEDLGCPFGFGCPWLNDVTFPGFPTFPVIGKEHKKIFGGLIPRHRCDSFCNQDLDPYLQRLYLQFGASPLLKDVELSNSRGGAAEDVRYKRIHAVGWRDWVLDDVDTIRRYVSHHSPKGARPKLLVDVVVPSYRLDLEFLERICSLHVPENWRTTFIIIVDNPVLLVKKIEGIRGMIKSTYDHQTLTLASCQLEKFLSEKSISSTYSGNNIRVRANLKNAGASASRNRGLDESAAEYVLFLDDDVIPESTLLEEYNKYLCMNAVDEETLLMGLVGMVKFPRHPNLPLKHAAVLMSYLTFMFEISSKAVNQHLAWGVTANLLVKRVPGLRFDTVYAKSGGGEDVDFCLRMMGGHLKAAPNAIVHHPFWDGSLLHLFSHFFHWAVGDSALFNRFPTLVYHSYPNAAETLLIIVLPMAIIFSWSYLILALVTILVVACDVTMDVADWKEFQNRCEVLEYRYHPWFYLRAHVLANLMVIVLEVGRLWGHLSRGQFVNVAKRFDWHCDRLPAIPRNFCRKELLKFASFISIICFANFSRTNYN